MLRCDRFSGLPAEEANGGWDALVGGRFRDIGGGFDAKHRNAARDEVLKKVAIIAGYLHYLAGRSHPEATIAISE